MIVKIEQGFPSYFLNKWLSLQVKCGVIYNTHPMWCKAWCEAFLSQANIIHIVSVYSDENCFELFAVFPLYVAGSTIRIIGSYPSLYDSAGILSCNEKAVIAIAEYLAHLPHILDLKDLNCSDWSTKIFVRCLSQLNKKFIVSSCGSKPFATQFKPTANLRSNISRFVRKAGENYAFGDLALAQVEAAHFTEELRVLTKQHYSTWGDGSIFVKRKNYNQFLLSLQQSGLLELYKIHSNNIAISYILLCVTNPNNVIMLLTTYDKKYTNIAPGKVGFYKLLEQYFADQDQTRIFDFGRGAEGYKYLFCNEDDILISIKSGKKLFKIFRLLSKIHDCFVKL